MSTVILAEKPSQARAYVDALQQNTKQSGYYEVSDPILPSDTTITFGFGHLVELAPPDDYDAKFKHWSLDNLPIFPEKYHFVVGADKQKQFKIVKKLLQAADTIIIATDSDREGSNIAWSIIKQAGAYTKNKTYQRLWINSLEKAAIREGFQHLRTGASDLPAYYEAQTRQISDWLVGMNASPLYTLLLRQAGVHGVYSIGRVQTPTLYMVYERDLAIKNFHPIPYLELQAQVQVEQQTFQAKLEPYQCFDDQKQLNTYMTTKNVQIGLQDGFIAGVDTTAKQTTSPRLFSLSSLQSAMNKQAHVSASETLKAVQALYEAKLLTYPRTDCQYITDQEFDYLLDNLTAYQALIPEEVVLDHLTANKRYINGAKVQEHHAIIMTKTIPTPAQLQKLTPLAQQIYDLVLRTTLAMFAQPYEYQETVIITQVGQALFKATGKVPTNPGWQVLLKQPLKEKKESKEPAVLPKVTQGQRVQVKLAATKKLTKAPIPFTEGTLITAMKTAGKTLEDADEQAILKEAEGIGTEATRANILEVLKKRQYLVTAKNQLHVSASGQTLCQAVSLQPLLTSPTMTAKWETALKQIGQQQRKPNNFLGQIQKFVQKLVDEVPDQLGQSTTMQQQINLQKEAEAKQQAVANLGQCPVCQQGQIVDKGKFYGCTNYKAEQSCQFTLPKKWSSKALTPTIVKTLLMKGTTTKLKGFKSKKTGKSFQAKLQLKNGQLAFDFGK